MRELRRPYAPVRSAARQGWANAAPPKPNTPLVPGEERAVPLAGLPGLQLIEVISDNG